MFVFGKKNRKEDSGATDTITPKQEDTTGTTATTTTTPSAAKPQVPIDDPFMLREVVETSEKMDCQHGDDNAMDIDPPSQPAYGAFSFIFVGSAQETADAGAANPNKNKRLSSNEQGAQKETLKEERDDTEMNSEMMDTEMPDTDMKEKDDEEEEKEEEQKRQTKVDHDNATLLGGSTEMEPDCFQSPDQGPPQGKVKQDSGSETQDEIMEGRLETMEENLSAVETNPPGDSLYLGEQPSAPKLCSGSSIDKTKFNGTAASPISLIETTPGKIESLLKNPIDDDTVVGKKHEQSTVEGVFPNKQEPLDDMQEPLDDDMPLDLKQSEVDLPYLMELLEETHQAQNVIAGKDVLLLIGNTGAGKTTTLLYLAGCKMEEQERDGEDHYEPVDFPSDALRAYKVGGGARSVTRTLQAFSITTLSIANSEVVLCDAPGFCDTDGIEQEIANSQALSRALATAKSVRPVIVLDREIMSGDRFKSLGSTLDTVLRMMSGSKKQENDMVDFKPFVYLFTRCDDKKSKRVHALLRKYRGDVEETASPLLLAFLGDLIEKTTPVALKVDPVDDDKRSELVEALCRGLGCKSSTIVDPCSVFAPFLPNDAGNALRLDLERALRRLDWSVSVEHWRSAEKIMMCLSRLSTLLPQAADAERSGRQAVKNHVEQRGQIIVSAFDNLSRIGPSSDEAFIKEVNSLQGMISVFVMCETIASLSCIDDDVRPSTILAKASSKLSSFLNKELGNFLSNEYGFDVGPTTWTLWRMKCLADGMGSLSAGHSFQEDFFLGIERVDAKAVQAIQAARDMFRKQHQAKSCNFLELEQNILGAKLLADSFRDKGVFLGISTGRAPHFELVLGELVSTVRNYIRTTKERLSDLSQTCHAMARSGQKNWVDSMSTMISDQVAPSRSFILSFSQAKHLCEYSFSKDEKEVIERAVYELDRSLVGILSEYVELSRKEVDKWVNAGLQHDDLASQRREAEALGRQFLQVRGICDKCKSWDRFDTMQVDSVVESLVISQKSVKDYVDAITTEETAIAKRFSDAISASKLVLDHLESLPPDSPDFSSILSEVMEPSNWKVWDSIVTSNTARRSIWGSVVDGFKGVLGMRSSKTSELSTNMESIVRIFHDRLMCATEMFITFGPIQSGPRVRTCDLMFFLKHLSTSLTLVVSFLGISKKSTFPQRVVHREPSDRLLVELKACLVCIARSFREFASLLERLQTDFIFDELASVQKLLSDNDLLWSEIRGFVLSPITDIYGHGMSVELQEVRSALLRWPRYDQFQASVLHAVSLFSKQVEGLSIDRIAETQNEDERNSFFLEISKLLVVADCVSLLDLPSSNAGSLEDFGSIAKQKVSDGVDRIGDRLIDALSRFPNNQDDFSIISSLVGALYSVERCFDSSHRSIARLAHYRRQDGASFIGRSLERMAGSSTTSADVLAKQLVLLKKASREIVCFGQEINNCIDSCIDSVASLSNDPGGFLLDLSLSLKSLKGEDSIIAQQILSEQACFEGIATSMFNNATAQQGIEYVLSRLQLSSTDFQKMQKMYDSFERMYAELVMAGIKRSRNGDTSNEVSIQADIQAIVRNYELNYADQLSAMTAQIFAHWSLMSSNSFVTSERTDSVAAKYLMKPHAAQVISVWTMMNARHQKDQLLENQLVEVKTGEGKSVILGVTSVLLALFGYRVDCICYSRYLSERDYRAFERLFSDFGVSDIIWYGTYVDLMKQFLGGNWFWSEGLNMLRNTPSVSTNDYGDNSLPRVLLIDEVDVLFHEDCFGECFYPVISPGSDSIVEFFHFTWNNCERLSETELLDSPEAIKICKTFQPEVHDIVWNEMKSLVASASRVKSNRLRREYSVVGGKIACKRFDGVVNWADYESAFLYVKEWEKGNITDSTMRNWLKLRIRGAQLSYFELPFDYSVILGVSGTLKDLDDSICDVLKLYDVSKYTYMPSVYGDNKLRFAEESDEGALVAFFVSSLTLCCIY